jgi:hypothetical protein
MLRLFANRGWPFLCCQIYQSVYYSCNMADLNKQEMVRTFIAVPLSDN